MGQRQPVAGPRRGFAYGTAPLAGFSATGDWSAPCDRLPVAEGCFAVMCANQGAL